jgi:hypothetical protein
MKENDRYLDRSNSLECFYCPHILNRRNETPKLLFTKKTEENPAHEILKLIPKKRLVKFLGSVETIRLHDVPPASQMTKKEKGALWWSRDEFKSFQSSIEIMSNSMRCRPEGAGTESSYASMIGRVYAECMNAKTDNLESIVDRDLLLQWARNAQCRRGLERRIVRSISMETHDARETVIHAMTDLNSNQMIDPDIKAESIRNLCTRMARPARLFAQCLAQADAECVAECIKAKAKGTRRSRTI